MKKFKTFPNNHATAPANINGVVHNIQVKSIICVQTYLFIRAKNKKMAIGPIILSHLCLI